LSDPKQATLLPLDDVLARINEEQTNKTKRLLSDLSSKRRSRQRKPIMVVNSGHPPRTMLPKLNIIMNSAESVMPQAGITAPTNDTLAQNIVYSGIY
jgi:hypothetical protein